MDKSSDLPEGNQVIMIRPLTVGSSHFLGKKEEIEQINRIEGINIGKIGFISISGFESKIDDIEQLSGEDLYAEL